MRLSMKKALYNFTVIALLVVLVLIIWQPIFPSAWVIQGLAQQIDPNNLALEKQAVLRFELAGRGGGNYNLTLSEDEVKVTEGTTSQADLIIAMKATDFNQLMFQMAQGKADEFTFSKLAISNTLRIAGDMSVLQLLDPTDRGEK